MHCCPRLGVCVQHKGYRMDITGYRSPFSSEHNKGHPRHRKRSDVFRWQPRYAQRFRCLLSLSRPVPSGGVDPSPPALTHSHFLNGFLLCLGKSPTRHVTGDFHCQEVETGRGMEARPLSRLTQHPANGEAKSLSTGTIRVGTRAAGPMGVRAYLWQQEFPLREPWAVRGKTGWIRGECGCFIVTLSCDQRQKYLGAVESQHTQHVEGKRRNSCPVYVKAASNLLLFSKFGTLKIYTFFPQMTKITPTLAIIDENRINLQKI